jgi:hypothetical protein
MPPWAMHGHEAHDTQRQEETDMSRLARVLTVTMLSMLTVMAALALPAAGQEPSDDNYPVPTEPERVVERDVLVEEAEVAEVRGVVREAAALPVTGGQVLTLALVAGAALLAGMLLLRGAHGRRGNTSAG